MHVSRAWILDLSFLACPSPRRTVILPVQAGYMVSARLWGRGMACPPGGLELRCAKCGYLQSRPRCGQGTEYFVRQVVDRSAAVSLAWMWGQAVAHSSHTARSSQLPRVPLPCSRGTLTLAMQIMRAVGSLTTGQYIPIISPFYRDDLAGLASSTRACREWLLAHPKVPLPWVLVDR